MKQEQYLGNAYDDKSRAGACIHGGVCAANACAANAGACGGNGCVANVGACGGNGCFGKVGGCGADACHANGGGCGTRACHTDDILIIISHRLTFMQKIDKIICLSDGSIKEIGTHDDLICQNGCYKKMYDLNSSKYK